MINAGLRMLLKDKIHINSSILIFAVIAIWYAITNFLWWHINTPIFPVYGSQAGHFLEIFKDNVSSPSLITRITGLMFCVFGKEHFDLIIIFINYIFFLIPLYFIYKIGKAIDSREAGNIAMVLFAMVPAVYALSRHYGNKDFHIIGAITFNIYCLLKTDSFKNRKWSLLYGVSVGLGLLVKEQFIGYFSAPLLWTIIVSLRQQVKRHVITNIVFSGIIACIMGALHYADPEAIKKVFMDPVIQSKSIFSYESFHVMIFDWYEQLLSLPIFLISLAGLWYFIKNYKTDSKTVILLWIFVPWTLVFLMPHYKLSVYFSGSIPAVILVASIFITHIKINKLKRRLIMFLLAIGIIQYINFSYFPEQGLGNIEITVKGKIFRYYYADNRDMLYFSDEDRSSLVNFIEYIRKLCADSNLSVYVNDKSKINGKVLRTAMLLNDIKCLPKDMERFVLKYKHDTILVVGELPIEIKKNKRIITQNFDMVATAFYFDGIDDKNNQIRIFKRKQTEKREKKSV